MQHKLGLLCSQLDLRRHCIDLPELAGPSAAVRPCQLDELRARNLLEEVALDLLRWQGMLDRGQVHSVARGLTALEERLVAQQLKAAAVEVRKGLEAVCRLRGD